MANPNPEIWGAPESWIYVPYSGGDTSETAVTYKYAAPKSPDFETGTTRGMLVNGITSGRITANIALDKTICPCGQDKDVSAFGSLAILNENGDGSTTPRIVERTAPCNWFMYDQKIHDSLSDFNRLAIFRDYTYSFNRGMKFDQWSPKSVDTGNYNGNYRIIPYTFWYMRSIVLRIEVKTFTTPTVSGTGGTWRTLDDWKTNHSTDHICGIRFITMTVNSLNTDTMTLSYITSTPNQYYFTGIIGILDEIPEINNNGELTDTTFYSFLKCNSQRQRGGVLFDETSGMPTTENLFILPAWNKFTGQTLRRDGNNSFGYYYYYDIPYSDDTYETILKMVACFGCYFTPTSKTSFGYDMTDTDLYLPIIDDEGIAHGEYTQGTGNLDNDLYSNDSIRNKDYDPSKQYDPNTYSNVTGFNSLTSGATMTKRYVLDAANVDKLGNDLWTICGSLSSQDFEYFDGKLKDEFLTTNPIDSIVSLQRFPFEIPHTGSSKSAIKIGKSTGTAEGYETNFVFDTIVFAGKDIFPRFGNCFLDYEPFTSYEIYVPFCGTAKIRAADILGHTLNITMQIDLLTGSCTAYIMADQLVIETMNGSCGVDQTVSGTQTATVNANIYNGILNQQLAKKQIAFQTAGALMPSNWINPIGYAARGEQAETAYKEATYSIEHIETPPHNIGSASPLLSWYQEFNARIIIYYPEGDVIQSSTPPSFNKAALQSFGHTKGFGTVTPGTVSSFHGYTQGTIIADQIPCTESERNRIKEAFASGVFLP